MERLHGRGMLFVAALAALGVVALTLGLGTRSASAQEGAAVTIVDFAFDPASVEIAAGGTVTWTNNGAAPHTATANDGSFDSGNMAPGASFSHTFATAGTFTYFCAIHPQMTGTVVVAAAAAAPVAEEAAAEAPAADEAAAAEAAPAGGEAAAPRRAPATGVGSMAADQRSLALALLAALGAAGLGLVAIRAYRRA